MNNREATSPAPKATKQFSVCQYKILKAAAQILGVGVTTLAKLLPKISDAYSLQDFEKLDAAADILGVSIGSEPEAVVASRHTPPEKPELPVQKFLPTNGSNVLHIPSSSIISTSSLSKVSGAVQVPDAPLKVLDPATRSSLSANAELNSLLEQGSFDDPFNISELDPTIEALTNGFEPGTATEDQWGNWQITSKTSHLKPHELHPVDNGRNDRETAPDPDVFDVSFFPGGSEDAFLQSGWGKYSNIELGNHNDMDLLMSTEMGQMSHLPSHETSQVMDDFSNTWNADVCSGNTEVLLADSTPWLAQPNVATQRIINLPEEQIGHTHIPSTLGITSSHTRDEQLSQTASSHLAKVGDIIPLPSKEYAPMKITYLPQQSFVNKIKKSQGTASKRSKVARQKKLKGPYLDDHLRQQTGNTRTNHACIRCQAQKMRESTPYPLHVTLFTNRDHLQCIPNPDDPTGICLRCIKQATKTIKAPCLRLMLSHCVLYRTNTTQAHLQVPPQYSNSDPKGASNFPHQQLELENLKYGQVFTFAVQQYPLSEQERSLSPLTPEGNLLTRRPYHIPNTHEFVDSYKSCIVADAAKCADRLLTGSNTLIWKIFARAFKLADANDGLKSKVVRSALHFWIAARSTESGWIIRNPESLGIGPEHKAKLDEIPYVEHQLTWILRNDFLAPLCAEVLADIQKINASGKADDWLGQFLATFIVLHNYELLVKRQKAFTISRKWTKTPYTNMSLLNNIHIGAKTILAAYHYSCKNGERFSMNWHNEDSPKILGFKGEDHNFIGTISHEANGMKDQIQLTSRNNRWEDDFWFTGQIFDSFWEPRAT